MATTDAPAPLQPVPAPPTPPPAISPESSRSPRASGRPPGRASGPSARTSGARWWFVHRGWQGYAAAVVLCLVATGLTALAASLLDRTIGILFVAAITVTAWYGGLAPALLATFISVVLLDALFIDPPGLNFHPADVLPLLIFGGVSAFVSWLSDSLRRAEARARRDADALDEIRKRLEQQALQLESSRDFLAEAQRSAQLGSWEWDVATNQVVWSDEMYRVYGLEPGREIDLATYRQFVHPDDRAMIDATLAESMRARTPFSYVHRITWPDGETRWLRGKGKPVVDRQGRIVRMVGSGQDITEPHRAAEAQRLLADASEALAASLDYATTLTTVAELCRGIADWCTIAIGDETGQYSTVAVAHRDPERVQWAREYTRMHPPRTDAQTGVAQVLRTGKPEFYPDISREMLVAAARSEDEMKVIDELNIRSAMVVPMRARGKRIGAITFISSDSAYRYTPDDLDLAQRLASRAAMAIDNARLFEEASAARAAAESANRAKMDFLAAMSHELRTPINAIAGYTQLLSMGVHGPITEQQRESLARLERSHRHLLALVEDVLTFARVEAGKMQLQFRDVSVDRVAREAVDLVSAQARTKDIALEYAGCDPDLVIRTDEDRVSQILLNLLTNAVKFTDTGGRVSVSVIQEPTTLSIAVADTGIGMPADRLEAIFEPFVQLEQRKQKRASGMGLGLAISRDLARALGGDVLVASEVGRGSTFTVRLPRLVSQG